MKKSIPVNKKSRGRPKKVGGVHPVTAVRLPPETGAAVDEWAADQKDTPGRSESIRRLIEIGLAATAPTSKRAHKMAWRKKTVEKWAERLADLGWRQRLDNLLSAAARGSAEQPEMFAGPRGEDYVRQEALELFGYKWRVRVK